MKVWTWGLWDQNININQIIEPTRVICFAAKWVGDRKIEFHVGDDMIERAWELLDEADAVMTYNGIKFDLPHLSREFVERGWGPPSPYQHIDLIKTARRRFRMPSNKLEYIARALGLDGKVKHEGFDLWVKCMAGDAAAWRRMEKYNKRDVTLLEDVYAVLQPWIPGHPNRNLYTDAEVCPKCGAPGTNLQRRGTATTLASKFQRWQCKACGGWFRSTRRLEGVTVQEAAL